MKVTLDFERPPLRAVYRAEFEIVGPSETFTAAAQAGAMLQMSESWNVRILSVRIERTLHTPRKIAPNPADASPAAGEQGT